MEWTEELLPGKEKKNVKAELLQEGNLFLHSISFPGNFY